MEQPEAAMVTEDTVMIVHGIEFTVDESYKRSWEAVDLLIRLQDKSIDNFSRMGIYFRLIEGLTGVTTEMIAEALGGPMVPADAVFAIAEEILEVVDAKK